MATYGSEAGVEAINAHRNGGYTATSVPSSTQITGFLDDGYAAINTMLAKAGYSVPVAAAATCYGTVVRLNNLFAAACAEEATNVSTAGTDGETRSERLWERFNTELTAFLPGDLSLVGLSSTTAASGNGRSIRSRELRRRDGYAHRYDPDNTGYGSSA